MRSSKPSRRSWFIATIQAQITGTRILAVVTFVVLVGGAAAWLAGTSGSPVIGVYFAVLAAVLSFTIYAFLRLMGMFIRRR
jgi:hypothetical protein